MLKLADLEAMRLEIESELASHYKSARNGAPAPVKPYVDLLRSFTLRGGKRFRAICLLAGYHIATAKSPTPVIPAASALEHFQSWMLIHDDIIDHGEQRRGGPTLHRSVALDHHVKRGWGSSEEYGTGAGIALGDLEEPFTVKALLRTNVSVRRRLEAIGEYCRMTELTAYGELLDIKSASLDPSQTHLNDVLLTHEFKSAVYTVVSPLRIGGVLGGASASLLQDFDFIGTNLGIAFQIGDDVVGAGFASDEAGKSSNDLIEGKRSILITEGWKRADRQGRKLISSVLGNRYASAEDIGQLQDLIRSCGSLRYSVGLAKRLRRRAEARIRESKVIRSEGKALLLEITERLLSHGKVVLNKG